MRRTSRSITAAGAVVRRTCRSITAATAVARRKSRSITAAVAAAVVRRTSTWSCRKVSDRIFLCEHLMDYNLARLHEPTLNLSAHA